ncbi:SPRY domain-containing SOCS box protein 4 [Aphelenchoides besseyi]|nr:SPRY domain-containing SOCS box protein 4 [Aphelenchoides besseyi]
MGARHSTSKLNYAFSASPESSDGVNLINGQWHVEPSTSTNPTNLSFLSNNLLQNKAEIAGQQTANLNDPNFGTSNRHFVQSPSVVSNGTLPSEHTLNQQTAVFHNLIVGGTNFAATSALNGQPIAQSSPIQRRGRRFSHHQSAIAQANGSPLSSALQQSASANSTPHRQKAAGRTPTLQQIGRNLIEFARASTPRIQRRMQTSKPDGESTSTHSVPLLYGHNNGASMIAGSRRMPLQQQHANNSPIKSQSLANETAGRISPAHPTFLNADFLDEGQRPSKLDVLLQMNEPTAREMEKHAWNPDDRSLNIYVKEDDRLTLHRHPVAQSTDCIRGRVGYSRGFHVWQIVWPHRQRGTHAVIGVATKQAGLHAPGYSSLVGSSGESYGWDITRNQCLHDSKNTSPWVYPNPNLVGDRFTAPERLYCILDMDEGYLAFATEDRYLGVAFRGIRGQILYPVVCAVWGHCEITMRYLGSLEPEPRGLMDICRRTIRLKMGPERINQVDSLHLPTSLKDYVLFRQRYRF